MAITLRGAQAGPSASGTSSTCNLPTGTTVGDVSIVAGAWAVSGTLSVSAGWTVLSKGPSWLIAYRVFQSGDASTVTVSNTTSGWNTTGTISYSGCDTSSPIDTSEVCPIYWNANTPASTTKYRAPSVNPNWNGSQLVCAYMETLSSTAGGTHTPASGMTSRLNNAAGPCVAFDDKALTDGTPTGNQDATWDARTYTVGLQIVLKASGASAATTATPRPTIAGMALVSSGGAPSSFSPDISHLSPKTGDLVVVAVAANTVIGQPPGYTAIQSLSGVGAVFARTWNNDSTAPTFSYSSGNWTMVGVLLLRKTGTGTDGVVLDSSTLTSGAGNAGLTTAGFTPNEATDEFLACFFFNGSDSSSGTWSATPSGLNNDFNTAYGPNMLIGWTQPAASPTGTFSATNSRTTTFAAIAAAFKVGTPPAVLGVQTKSDQRAQQVNNSAVNQVQLGKAPATNAKTVSGTVTVGGVATGGLLVRAYAKITGEFVGEATTAGDGTYSIKCGNVWKDVYVIAFDPTTYRAVTYDQVVPG